MKLGRTKDRWTKRLAGENMIFFGRNVGSDADVGRVEPHLFRHMEERFSVRFF